MGEGVGGLLARILTYSVSFLMLNLLTCLLTYQVSTSLSIVDLYSMFLRFATNQNPTVSLAEPMCFLRHSPSLTQFAYAPYGHAMCNKIYPVMSLAGPMCFLPHLSVHDAICSWHMHRTSTRCATKYILSPHWLLCQFIYTFFLPHGISVVSIF